MTAPENVGEEVRSRRAAGARGRAAGRERNGGSGGEGRRGERPPGGSRASAGRGRLEPVWPEVGAVTGLPQRCVTWPARRKTTRWRRRAGFAGSQKDDERSVGRNEVSGALETCCAVPLSSPGGHPASSGLRKKQPRVPSGLSAIAACEPSPWAPPRVPAALSREVAGLLLDVCYLSSLRLLRPANQDRRNAFPLGVFLLRLR